jgi:hypothetical protein
MPLWGGGIYAYFNIHLYVLLLLLLLWQFLLLSAVSFT